MINWKRKTNLLSWWKPVHFFSFKAESVIGAIAGGDKPLHYTPGMIVNEAAGFIPARSVYGRNTYNY